jgi:hypothetical protein
MLFVTNRGLDQGPVSKPGRVISFDLNDNSAQHSVYFCERTAKDTYTEIGSLAFLQRLKDLEVEQLLFFVHGYSNLPEPNIFPRAQKLQKLLNGQKKKLAAVVPIIWPCDNDLGIAKDYWDDQKAADASGFAFARVLEKFEAWRNQQANITAAVPQRLPGGRGHRQRGSGARQLRRGHLPGVTQCGGLLRVRRSGAAGQQDLEPQERGGLTTAGT